MGLLGLFIFHLFVPRHYILPVTALLMFIALGYILHPEEELPNLVNYSNQVELQLSPQMGFLPLY